MVNQTTPQLESTSSVPQTAFGSRPLVIAIICYIAGFTGLFVGMLLSSTGIGAICGLPLILLSIAPLGVGTYYFYKSYFRYLAGLSRHQAQQVKEGVREGIIEARRLDESTKCCVSCGAECPPSAAFCPSCGAIVGREES